MAPFFIRKDIAINCWKEIPNIENYVHFYARISNSTTSVPDGLLEKLKPIYTSPFLAWYMLTYIGAPSDVFKIIEFNIEHTVHKNGKEITFVFIATQSYNPNFMILFKSELGDELFAGDCKFTEDTLKIKSILPYFSSKTLANLHFDGSYMDCLHIPTWENIKSLLIDIIKSYKRKIIYISANRLGNEMILTEIAKGINKKIHVSPEKFIILKKLGLDRFFSTELSTTYIRTIEYNQISIKRLAKRNRLVGPSITIVLSLRLFLTHLEDNEDFEKNGIFFFPLSYLNTPSDFKIIKQIRTRNFTFTNLLPASSNHCSTVDYSSEPESPRQVGKVYLKHYSKYKTLNAQLTKELQKCESEYWMSWEEYLKWRRNHMNLS